MTFLELITSHHHTASSLARKAGVSRTLLYDLTKDQREYNHLEVRNAVKVASALGLTIEEVLISVYGIDYPTKM